MHQDPSSHQVTLTKYAILALSLPMGTNDHNATWLELLQISSKPVVKLSRLFFVFKKVGT